MPHALGDNPWRGPIRKSFQELSWELERFILDKGRPQGACPVEEELHLLCGSQGPRCIGISGSHIHSPHKCAAESYGTGGQSFDLT